MSRSAEWLGIGAAACLWTVTLLSVRSQTIEPQPRSRRAAVADVRPVDFPVSNDASSTLVVGLVVDAQGRAVPGAVVFVSRSSALISPSLERVVTDDRGRFRVVGLVPGRYCFVAIHGHHPPGAKEFVPVFPSEHASRVEITLDLDDIEA